MTKQVKKSYRYLDLPYSASEQDVLLRQKMLIKFWRAKGIKHQKSYKKKIDKLVECSNIVLENIKENGSMPAKPEYNIESKTLLAQIFTLFLLVLLAIVIFYTMLN